MFIYWQDRASFPSHPNWVRSNHTTIQQVPVFTPQGLKMIAASSINEIKTWCSVISTASYLYGIVAFISGTISIWQPEGHTVFNKDWVCIQRL
jgi:hypothetical protein